MVIIHNLHDLIEISRKAESFKLPTYKENGLNLIYKNVDGTDIVYQGKVPPLPFSESGIFMAQISNWRRLTHGNNCKTVYEVTFDIEGSNFKFKPGDTIGIIPQNCSADVDFILKHLKLTTQADQRYELTVDKDVKGSKIPAHIPVQATLRHVFMNLVDIRGLTKKLFLLALSKYTKDDDERNVLEYLCSTEGSVLYNTQILEKNISILDLFNTYRSCQPPIEVILAHLPRLLPRPYSIVNSQLANKNLLKICFSVIECDSNRKGLTTGFLERILLKDNLENKLQNLSVSYNEIIVEKIPIYLRKNMNGFRLPTNIEEPLILIGSGTGVAPFIGFLEERLLLKTDSIVKSGDIWLFFGCRNPELDFLYERELSDFVEGEVLTKLSTAFSRIENKAKYVQDAIAKNGEEMAKFIRSGATIFVCGDLKKMAAEVREVLKRILVDYDGKTIEEADNYIYELEKSKKYYVDIWS